MTGHRTTPITSLPPTLDPHVTMTFSRALEKGCTCEYGCRTCGLEASQMGNCPAWNPCPIGRAPADDCPLLAVTS